MAFGSTPPSASPETNRRAIRVVTDPAIAVASVNTAKNSVPAMIIIRRPNQSASGPPISAPIVKPAGPKRTQERFVHS